MGVSYPASVDTFPVPALPETTSLSSAGSANRAHTDHHRDLGLGLTAVMTNAALKTHGHTGADGTAKLSQANTHEGVDTDTALSAIHHTLGTAANQAAAGNHVHDYNGPTITGKPYLICLSSARPLSPYIGLTIYESDTNRLRTWCQLPGTSSPSWRLVPGSPVIPFCRLRQTVAQQLSPTGSIVEWGQAVEDVFGYWTISSKTDIVVKEAGLYQIEAALQWNDDLVPDIGTVVLCINGQETSIRNQQFMRGNLFTPSFSQTLQVAGKLRFAANDILTVKVTYTPPQGIIGFILSFFDGPGKIQSRVDLGFLGC